MIPEAYIKIALALSFLTAILACPKVSRADDFTGFITELELAGEVDYYIAQNDHFNDAPGEYRIHGSRGVRAVSLEIPANSEQMDRDATLHPIWHDINPGILAVTIPAIFNAVE